MLSKVDGTSSRMLDMHGRLERIREIVVAFISSRAADPVKQKAAILHSIAYGGLGGSVVTDEEPSEQVHNYLRGDCHAPA